MRLLPVMVVTLTVVFLCSCKTTESNYRAAYETAVAKNRESAGVDSTIYARIRNSAQMSDLAAGSDTMPMRTEYIGYTENGGSSRETIGRYNVVVGQFKQVFNARQMRERLQKGGYDSAFIVHTREPLYYVCTQACSTPAEAAEAFKRVRSDKSIVLRSPLPFILRPAHMAR
ncbi:MAG: SPOR domain-containing protein [Staphylococcus sp.]|nr:SPOR domain-containing protein [Staphylococcus sp.]